MLQFERVVIVGVGLLGGSIGLALRERKLAKTIVGVGRNAQSLDQALQLGIISHSELDLSQACRDADLVIVCTPVQRVVEFVVQCQSSLKSGAMITDVGSTKQSICDQLDAAGCSAFCGSHPLAGSDKSGPSHADGALLEGKLVVVTPGQRTPAELLSRTLALWQSLGSRTLCMSPQEHDAALARTSHLPHVVAAALAGVTPESLLPLAASGWCDTTRVASGNVDLWRQILSENRDSVLAATRDFAAAFQSWITALEHGDDEALIHLLQRGKSKRDTVGN